MCFDPKYKVHGHTSPYWQLAAKLAGGHTDDNVSFSLGWVAMVNRDTLVPQEEELDVLHERLESESS